MFRPSTSRSIARALTSTSRNAVGRAHHNDQSKLQLTAIASNLREKRQGRSALAVYNSELKPIQRYASTVAAAKTPFDSVTKDVQDKLYQTKLDVDTEDVSSDSSYVPVIDGGEDEKSVDMLAGVKSDIKTIEETFALTEVPREAYYIGMAGVLPYLATSLSTVYLAWDINHAFETGTGFLLSGHTAELLLHIIEPLQVGYGAVIISFLGAIHWGLEFAGYGGYQRYQRYAVGVIAPAIAWPTIMFPVEYALITQFFAFNLLYFADARATVRGWFPAWYSTYRFVLTFVVGASIVLTLIGRGQIADRIGKMPSTADHIIALRNSQSESLEQEEEDRRQWLVSEDEAEDEE
ncbi:MAG: hypothetical protein M1825_004023 [Sarcosagium campestre]|nr:MAG: hypothetical protein M1825_004023 [Sarcosagium campestre]